MRFCDKELLPLHEFKMFLDGLVFVPDGTAGDDCNSTVGGGTAEADDAMVGRFNRGDDESRAVPKFCRRILRIINDQRIGHLKARQSFG